MVSRFDPFSEIARLHDEMVRMQGGREMAASRSTFTPVVDILDTENAILVKAELPGVKAADIHVTVENDVLTLKGERKSELDDTKRQGLLRVERTYGGFTRSFSLPKTVDGSNIDADMTDGVLTLTIPKRKAPEPKRIEVRPGNSAPAAGGKPS